PGEMVRIVEQWRHINQSQGGQQHRAEQQDRCYARRSIGGEGGMTDKTGEWIAGALQALDGFMTAFNAEDADAIRTRWFHFPHVRFHSGRITVMATAADYHSLVWQRTGQSRE